MNPVAVKKSMKIFGYLDDWRSVVEVIDVRMELVEIKRLQLDNQHLFSFQKYLFEVVQQILRNVPSVLPVDVLTNNVLLVRERVWTHEFDEVDPTEAEFKQKDVLDGLLSESSWNFEDGMLSIVENSSYEGDLGVEVVPEGCLFLQYWGWFCDFR